MYGYIAAPSVRPYKESEEIVIEYLRKVKSLRGKSESDIESGLENLKSELKSTRNSYIKSILANNS